MEEGNTMKTLKDQLLTPEKRPAVVADCVNIVEEEVGAKSGISGAAIKLAFATVKKVKPGIIREAVDGLLDDFVGRMEPYYADFQKNPNGSPSIDTYAAARGGEIADALLGVTDDRAARSTNKTLKAAYEKLRPMGKKQVEGAMPRVGKMLVRHGA
jgi:hypothetical protein